MRQMLLQCPEDCRQVCFFIYSFFKFLVEVDCVSSYLKVLSCVEISLKWRRNVRILRRLLRMLGRGREGLF